VGYGVAMRDVPWLKAPPGFGVDSPVVPDPTLLAIPGEPE
jgi:hypothetical protein